jgi:hypothetical protein
VPPSAAWRFRAATGLAESIRQGSSGPRDLKFRHRDGNWRQNPRRRYLQKQISDPALQIARQFTDVLDMYWLPSVAILALALACGIARGQNRDQYRRCAHCGTPLEIGFLSNPYKLKCDACEQVQSRPQTPARPV